MASGSEGIAQLRAVCDRLGQLQDAKEHHDAPALAESLARSVHVFALPREGNTSNELAQRTALLQQLGLKLTAMLSSRQRYQELAALMLVKALIRGGSGEIMTVAMTCMKPLLRLFVRPTVPTVKRMSIIVIVRIIDLVQPIPRLLREMTSTHIPTFLHACLTLLKSAQKTTLVVLHALYHILPKHPTLFRPHLPPLQSLLLALFTPAISRDTQQAARKLLVALHRCLAGSNAAETWTKGLSDHIAAARNISTCVRQGRSVKSDATYGLLGAWSSVDQAMHHLKVYLTLIHTHLNSPSPGSVGVPVSSICTLVAVIARLPSSRQEWKQYQDIDTNQWQSLSLALPSIRLECLNIFSVLLDRFGSCLMALVPSLLRMTLQLFRTSTDPDPTYVVLTGILLLTGRTIPLEDSSQIDEVLLEACKDIETWTAAHNAQKAKTGMLASIQLDPGLEQTGSVLVGAIHSEQQMQRAVDFVAAGLSRLPRRSMSRNVRARVDATAIMCQIPKIMLASTMNPAYRGTAVVPSESTLPFLAQMVCHDPGVEALMHPQMPVVQYSVDQTEAGDPLVQRPGYAVDRTEADDPLMADVQLPGYAVDQMEAGDPPMSDRRPEDSRMPSAHNAENPQISDYAEDPKAAKMMSSTVAVPEITTDAHSIREIVGQSDMHTQDSGQAESLNQKAEASLDDRQIEAEHRQSIWRDTAATSDSDGSEIPTLELPADFLED